MNEKNTGTKSVISSSFFIVVETDIIFKSLKLHLHEYYLKKSLRKGINGVKSGLMLKVTPDQFLQFCVMEL